MSNALAPSSWRAMRRLLFPALLLLIACGTLQVFVEQPGGTPTPPVGTPAPPLVSAVSINVRRVTFAPSTPGPLGRSPGFNFGAELEFECDCDATASVVAFFLRPEDSLPDCRGAINVILPFWADQQEFAPGQHTFDRKGFPFQDEPSANALVIRASLMDAGRVLYCAQQVYPLAPSAFPSTPGPASTVQPAGVSVAILSDQWEAGHVIAASSPVMVVATAPEAVRVEFYTSAVGNAAASQMEFVDTDASDGWVWSWPAPLAAMQAQVWAEAYYADGSHMASPALRVATPDVIAALPTLTLSPTPILFPAYVTDTPLPCEIADPPGYVSPDGRYAADDNGVVSAPGDGRCTRMEWPKWVRFVAWTADSRYALYTLYDQYGNAGPVGFDTQAWTQFSAGLAGLGDMQGRNGNGVAAVAPSSPRIISGNGDVIHLPDSPRGNLLAGTGKTYVARAAWSPDETHLAFLAYSQRSFPVDTVLYLAQGDGAQPQPITLVEFINWQPLTVSWSGDGAVVVVATDLNHYTLDVASGQLQIVPVPGSPTPTFDSVYAATLAAFPAMTSTPPLETSTPAATVTP